MAAGKHDPFTACTRVLLSRFRRQRPLRGGSLLVTILGDAIAPRGGTIALGSLIRLAQPFGLTERLVRTSIGRLANAGWVSSRRIGRASEYSLTTEGSARFAEATQRIYGSTPQRWDGRWTIVMIPPELKRARDRLREQLSWLGFGQLTSGVHAHPTHTRDDTLAQLSSIDASGQLIVMHSRSETDASDAQLVAMGWDFGDLTRRYRHFIRMFSPAQAALHAGASPMASEGETCFLLRTLLLHEYRRIHLRDPMLPVSLLPQGWAGGDAYELCRGLYARMFQVSEGFLSATVRTMSGPLPQPGAEIYQRFGGLPRH